MNIGQLKVIVDCVPEPSRSDVVLVRWEHGVVLTETFLSSTQFTLSFLVDEGPMKRSCNLTLEFGYSEFDGIFVCALSDLLVQVPEDRLDNPVLLTFGGTTYTQAAKATIKTTFDGDTMESGSTLVFHVYETTETE